MIFLRWVSILLVFISMTVEARWGLNGLISGWTAAVEANPSCFAVGGRYLPRLWIISDLGTVSELSFRFDGSWESWGQALFSRGSRSVWQGKSRLFRCEAALLGSQWDIHLGQQKLNFGSAVLLRPLRWFDNLDIRDPLQLTSGVWALVGRYVFLNNVNLRGWLMAGDTSHLAGSVAPAFNRGPEWGGRAQIPWKSGEWALTWHKRRVETVEESTHFLLDEYRGAIDAKWDWILGWWIEAMAAYQSQTGLTARQWYSAATFGLDYTFAWGEGLRLTGEMMLLKNSVSFWRRGTGNLLGALMADYPLNLLDRARAVVWIERRTGQCSYSIDWERLYDRWRFSTILIRNPHSSDVFHGQSGLFQHTGWAFQFMFSYNY